ncbi:ABC transporter substrate-binding protein [Bradyrhizobium oligotrophicum]|uniref:ABC transporter substrate-binding protein n=1 Tax=Bradyrhizobium oligotrophicum TaxID=44255 RepID=UPI003EB77B56
MSLDIWPNRRSFISVLGGGALLLPSYIKAQQRLPVIGFLGNETAAAWKHRLDAFRKGLAEQGYIEGRNLDIEYRWAESRNEQLPKLAAELAGLRVSALVVLGGTSSAVAAKDAASLLKIPVIFRIAVDPVTAGLVQSLNRPGANVTGVTTMGVDLGPKQLDLLHELTPDVTDYGLLSNPTNPSISELQSRDIPKAAARLGLRIHVFNVSSVDEFPDAFVQIDKLRIGGLIIGADTFLNARSKQLAELSSRLRLPTVSPYADFPRNGGLMSYGASITAASQQAGVYVARILKGERPADLPILQPTTFEFVINIGAAKSLGIQLSPAFLSRVDETIE